MQAGGDGRKFTNSLLLLLRCVVFIVESQAFHVLDVANNKGWACLVSLDLVLTLTARPANKVLIAIYVCVCVFDFG